MRFDWSTNDLLIKDENYVIGCIHVVTTYFFTKLYKSASKIVFLFVKLENNIVF